MKFSLALLLTFFFVYREAPAIIFNQMDIKSVLTSGALDLNVLRCFLHNKNICPSPYIMYRLYSPKSSRHGIVLNIHNPLTLFKGDFNPHRETAFIVHGFNGTAVDVHLQFLKDDWRPLTRYPCYLHALINTRLTAQCTAQVYSFLTHHGAAREKITCIGHSLGAHICGMISNHLTIKQHRIIGLDPARPLIERKKNHIFRLSIDDASVIQVIHTNAGFLGQEENIGHLNYCINGGRFQPFCKGNPIRRSRCSHFLSICFLASAMFKHKKFVGISCPNGCKEGSQHNPVSAKNPFGIVTKTEEYNIGNDAPDDARGCYCIDMPFVKHCPFND
ncbi:PREDICTED: lipase member H-A isoform X2 [Bactrocera latifrons]|uniref:lipase member H-A isoform X2 n=1 Tax=Bactrocera latifrons TaxID=174628 RepID=UPI0008DE42C1|nr:PREDICTED: lipase member H-A isoform X2 [Bactrocera latifrons]